MRKVPCLVAAVVCLWGFFAGHSFAAPSDAPLAWRQAIGGRIMGRPAAQAESVVVACDDRSLRAYGKSGTSLWSFDSGGKLGPHISRSPEGTCYIARTDNIFIAVNRSGRELWRTKIDSPLACPAIVGFDGRVFLLTERSIACWSAAGLLKWRRPVPAKPSSQAVLDASGGVITGFENGTAFRCSAFGQIASFSTSSPPSAVADYQTEAGNRLIASLADGRIVMEDPESGTASLIASMGYPASGMAVREGKLGILLKDGTVGLLDIEAAAVLWTGRAPPSRSWAFRFDERGLYALGDAGAAGFAPDGRRLWNLSIAGASSPPELSDEGVLYSGGDDWILYAYKVEERIRSKTNSLYAQTETGDYGLADRGGNPEDENPFAFEEAAIVERLAFIALSVGKHEIGEMEREFTAFLLFTAGSERSAVKKKGLPSILPHFRSQAAELLGALGSREVLPFLSDVFRRDPESVVRAAAAEAIGAIGSDPGGETLSVFAQAVYPPEPVRDERLLLAVAESIGALCRFSGPPLSDQGIRLLVYLSSQDRPSVVRKRARVELESLSPHELSRK